MKRAFALVLVVAAAGAGVWFYFFVTGRSQPAPPKSIVVTRPAMRDNHVVLQPERVPHRGPITAKAAIDALLATADQPGRTSAMPKGTRLLSVQVQDEVAVVDLSKDFEALDTMGDTGESLAQNALRRALAQVPGIDRMTVEVEGKVYSGEHSGDWQDIPVHDTGSPDTAPQ